MFWFKNLQLYKFSGPFECAPEQLNERLVQHPFQPCGAHERGTRGWVHPFGLDTGVVHSLGDRSLIVLRREDKDLPAAVVRRYAAERAEAIEAREGQAPGRRQRKEIEEQVALELLPQAFTKLKHTRAYIDAAGGWIGVEAASRNAAADFLSILREHLGSLPVRPLSTRSLPGAVMTEWLRASTEVSGFEIGGDCELRDAMTDGGAIKCKQQDLFSDEVRQHVQRGKEVKNLALSWRERLSFVLDEDLGLTRIKPLDLLLDDLGPEEFDDRVAAAEAEFALMCGELAKMVPELLGALGGEAEQGLVQSGSAAVA